ncbi:hypothetical protein HYT92_00530 [Candidatus Pacearchaeota archaeon]|nr:hypothetical protein [Candidatus Pacearchaeota archaeon]
MKKEAKQKDEKPAANSMREKKPTKLDTEQALLENFVSLQRVLTNLSIKFDTLSDNISKLLQLFEISAKGFIGKQGIKEIDREKSVERDREFLAKLNTLLDQNKTIAKGLTLMGERVRENISGEGEARAAISERDRMPQFLQRQPQFSQQRKVEPQLGQGQEGAAESIIYKDSAGQDIKPRPLPRIE